MSENFLLSLAAPLPPTRFRTHEVSTTIVKFWPLLETLLRTLHAMRTRGYVRRRSDSLRYLECMLRVMINELHSGIPRLPKFFVPEMGPIQGRDWQATQINNNINDAQSKPNAGAGRAGRRGSMA
jgi:hypothetical protein